MIPALSDVHAYILRERQKRRAGRSPALKYYLVTGRATDDGDDLARCVPAHSVAEAVRTFRAHLRQQIDNPAAFVLVTGVFSSDSPIRKEQTQ